MTIALRILLTVLTLPIAASPFGPAAAQEKENVILILDASGSMWGRVDGREKILIAREVVGSVLADIGDKVDMGIIAYGHRRKGDCSDIETVLPVGRVDVPLFTQVINSLQPKGKTPITASVLKAAEELRYREQKSTIILVSDGLETCKADPCALASRLEREGIDFTVHVVGFDLKNEDTRTLQCLADNTGGRFLSADNADELNAAIGEVVAEVQTVAPPPPPPEPVMAETLLKVDVFYADGGEILDNAYVTVFAQAADGESKGEQVTGGSMRNPFKVPPGKYYVETRVGKATAGTDVEVAEGGTTRAIIVLGAGLLHVTALPEAGGKPLDQAYIYVEEAAQGVGGTRPRVTAGNQRNVFTIPAGKYYVRAVLGKASAGTEVEVKAGERTETSLIIGLGLLKVVGVPADGARPLDVYVTVFEAEKQLDGTRKRVTGGNSRNQFKLAAGRYYVEVKKDKAKAGQLVEVPAGALAETTININAGSLLVKADRKTRLVLYEGEKNLDGTRNRIGGLTPNKPLILPAGRYALETKIGGETATADVEITAGKLTELPVGPQ